MKLAVIGVGVMGSAIARRLLDTGAAVHVHDVLAERSALLAQQGAEIAVSARAATALADFVILSLNTAQVVENAVFGADGVAAAADSSKLLIDMSSIDPRATAALALRLARATGMGWVDAPLSGGAPAAAHGGLTLMVGGSDADVARARPVLARLSNHMTHLGAVGSGQTVKLVNQILCAGTFIAVAEATRFAEQLGVDATRIPAALAGGRADSRILQEFMAKMARRDFSPTGRIDNMLKDLETVQATALQQRIALPLTALVAELHRMLVAGGFGAADSAAYVQLFDLGAQRTQ
jgi:2-hydroxy-3-oxopropionate reductase